MWLGPPGSPPGGPPSSAAQTRSKWINCHPYSYYRRKLVISLGLPLLHLSTAGKLWLSMVGAMRLLSAISVLLHWRRARCPLINALC
jgi:hypothetical protein